jgi:hypothetical protein
MGIFLLCIAIFIKATTIASWPVSEVVCNAPETGTLVLGDSVLPYDTITLPQFMNPVDGFYTGYKISITSGTGRSDIDNEEQSLR